MVKKAKKSASRPKPERTRSRVPEPEKNRTLSIDKLGKVFTWKVPDAPYASEPNLRPVFVGGFELRAQHVNSDAQDQGIPLRFNEGSKEQRAFEDGYHEAARQDGTHLKPKALAGADPAPAEKAGKKKR